METKNNKQGAASFYMIIVSALLFGVIAAGFITLMVSEMSKSSENNLSQTAYDSALVGVEDAKILIRKYNIALAKDESKREESEKELISKVQNAMTGQDCLESELFDPAKSSEGNDVYIQEIGDGDEETTVQAYTCISVDFHPTDYLATLNSENPIRLIPLQAVEEWGDGGNKAVRSVRISWYSSDNLAGQGTNYFSSDKISVVDNLDNAGNIISSDHASNPPVLVASLYQAQKDSFSLGDFSSSNVASDTTNRGTLWLIPTSENVNPAKTNDTDYDSWGSFKASATETDKTEEARTTKLKPAALLNSNNHEKESNPITHNGHPVHCATKDEMKAQPNLGYLCSVEILLPNPTGERASGENARGTFLLALALPYGQPLTDIRVEMSKSGIWDTTSGNYNAAAFDNVQTVIDSTGRANDVFSRVESRIESLNADFPFPDYSLTAGDGGDNDAIWKDFITASYDYNGCWYSSISDGGYNTTDCPS